DNPPTIPSSGIISDGKPIESPKAQSLSTENSKSRTKKKSMLQEMLLRNKNKAATVRDPPQGSGLAQFLSGL
ncbi:hypothetical protein BDQ17DRAFT_1349364, partial [Cyathus striatus]